MSPRNPVHRGPDGRGFFGTVTVGQRGQISIPAQARKDLGLEPGDQLVVLVDPAQGISLVPLTLLLDQTPGTNPLADLTRMLLTGQEPPTPAPPPGPPPTAPADMPPHPAPAPTEAAEAASNEEEEQ